MAFYLREAVKEDMDLLYRWANDSEVRKNAFHTEQIPLCTHKVWFENMLKDKNVLQYILVETREESCEKVRNIGQIRFSLEGDRAIIDYSIANEMRGKGFGVKIIRMAEEKLRHTRKEIVLCVAEVKDQNIASRGVFEKCGYEVGRKKGYDIIEYLKRMK